MPAEALRLLDEAQALEARTPSYYGAAWNALARIWLTTGWLSPGGSAC